MNTVQTWQTVSTSTAATAQLAEAIGAKLRGGEVIELSSDLGGGKTTFVRSLVKGMGSDDKVASPTFTISREYQSLGSGLTFYHFDFYRLHDAGVMANELAEVAGNPKTVVAVEWAGIVEDVLPSDRLRIEIVATGENDRQFTFTYPEKLAYLLPR